MKKRRKLRSWVKILLIIITSVIIYQKTGVLGQLAQNNIFYLSLCSIAWIWLFFGQFITLYFVLESEVN